MINLFLYITIMNDDLILNITIYTIIIIILYYLYTNYNKKTDTDLTKNKKSTPTQSKQPDFSNISFTVTSSIDPKENFIDKVEFLTVDQIKSKLNNLLRFKLNWTNPSENMEFIESWELKLIGDDGTLISKTISKLSDDDSLFLNAAPTEIELTDTEFNLVNKNYIDLEYTIELNYYNSGTKYTIFSNETPKKYFEHLNKLNFENLDVSEISETIVYRPLLNDGSFNTSSTLAEYTYTKFILMSGFTKVVFQYGMPEEGYTYIENNATIFQFIPVDAKSFKIKQYNAYWIVDDNGLINKTSNVDEASVFSLANPTQSIYGTFSIKSGDKLLYVNNDDKLAANIQENLTNAELKSASFFKIHNVNEKYNKEIVRLGGNKVPVKLYPFNCSDYINIDNSTQSLIKNGSLNMNIIKHIRTYNGRTYTDYCLGNNTKTLFLKFRKINNIGTWSLVSTIQECTKFDIFSGIGNEETSKNSVMFVDFNIGENYYFDCDNININNWSWNFKNLADLRVLNTRVELA